jgi:hypothetical protein
VSVFYVPSVRAYVETVYWADPGRRRSAQPARLLVVLLVAGLTIMLAGCGGPGTKPAAAAGPLDGEGAASVVPSGGTAAGKGYAYWLERVQLVGFEGPFTPPSCVVVVSAGGQRVALLFAHWPGHSLSITCSEPAGRNLYVAELFTVCSTLEGLPGFGTPPAELEPCARSDFTRGTQKGVSYGVTLDGQPTRAVVGATGTYYVPKVVSGGLCGLACVPAPAYAAGYGAGVLLSGLSKGTHIIHQTVSAPFNVNVTYTIHVS